MNFIWELAVNEGYGKSNYIWNLMGRMEWKCNEVKYLDPLMTFLLDLSLLNYVRNSDWLKSFIAASP